MILKDLSSCKKRQGQMGSQLENFELPVKVWGESDIERPLAT